VFANAPEGRYHKTLDAAGLKTSSLLPDYIVVPSEVEGVLLVEAKFTSRGDSSPDQVGIKDMFSYLHDFGEAFQLIAQPRGLVVAWSSTAVPKLSDVMVTPPARLGQAVQIALDSWSR